MAVFSKIPGPVYKLSKNDLYLPVAKLLFDLLIIMLLFSLLYVTVKAKYGDVAVNEDSSSSEEEDDDAEVR